MTTVDMSQNVASLEHACQLATLLRDFFNITDSQKRYAIYKDINVQAKACEKSVNSDELEYAFNRLFVGPDKVVASLYASIYLDAEPLLMGKSTILMRELLRAIGLEVADKGQPDDFIAYEFEAWLILVAYLDKVSDEKKQNILDAIDWLINEHMAIWLPKFIAKLKSASSETASSEDVAMLMPVIYAIETWLGYSLQRSLYEKN